MNPDAHTIKEFFIEVGDGHQLYVHDWGNKKARNPLIFLHGGPGSSTSDHHKRQFDPLIHRVIFFDQRGCGRSLPYGSIEHNTTSDIVEDIEKIAKQLKLPLFVLVGGSWGACLALAFAVKYPKRVKALVINGVFTGSHAEIDYFDRGDFRDWFPEAWQQYLDATPKSHHASPTKYHYQRILGKNEKALRESACAYENLEGGLISLDDRFEPATPNEPEYDPSGVLLEVHYLANYCFLPDRHVFKNAHRLTMPVWMVQGRYDMVCPPKTAYELHQKLPNSHLIWTIGGHRSSERETQSVTKAILQQFGEAK